MLDIQKLKSKQDRDKRNQRAIYIKDSTWELLYNIAKAENLSVSRIIEHIIEETLNETERI